jgi:gamma-glutamyltranspeptidase / glutathione hydrolase
VLAAGGTVVDAAVATAFATGVADVGRTGVGGYGGHLVFHEASSGQTWLVDFPSRAPLALIEAPRISNLAAGPLAIGVPGVVAGLGLAHERFGSLPWADLLAPAIRLCEEGVELRGAARDMLFDERPRIGGDAETVRVFLDGWQGDRLFQPELAESLRVIASGGPSAMYTGELADTIARGVRAAGGVLDHADLAGYEPEVTAAQRSTYRGFELRTPGEGSGASVLLPVLAALEGIDLPSLEPLGWQRIDYLATALAAVWQPRLSPPGCTDHFTVLDADGNVAACTTTLHLLLGSGVTVPGTGIVLNSAMGLFDPLPGRANSIAPGKTTLTNMCPTVVLRDGAFVLSTGASGGRRIPGMLAQAITLVLDHGWPVGQALAAPRLSHEGTGELVVEAGLSSETVHGLRERGYTVDERQYSSPALGGQAPAVWFDGGPCGAPDPRRHGGAAGL